MRNGTEEEVLRHDIIKMSSMKKSFYAKLGKTIFLTKESAEQELDNMVKRNEAMECE